MDGKGSPTWVPVEPPRDDRFPLRGATVTVAGPLVYVDGGFDAKGELTRSRFVYDLSQGAGSGFSKEAWSRNSDYDAGAFPVVAHVDTDRGTFNMRGGGIGSVDEAEGKLRAIIRETPRLYRSGSNGYGDIVGSSGALQRRRHRRASTLSIGQFVFIGPGSKRDGKVVLLDTRSKDEADVPDLPAKVGQGQLRLEDSKVVYSGGFDPKGRPSATVWSLDLNDSKPKWKEAGESAYLAGPAKVVDLGDGRGASVMVTPKGSAMWFLEAGVGSDGKGR